MKPLLLDLFCGAGGAAMGYYQAGFRVVGVDIKPQPHYPFQFIQIDALEFAVLYGKKFDVIHASPPCQAFSIASQRWINAGLRDYPDLLEPTRELLQAMKKPYVIENVQNAPLINPMTLCGAQFGLRVFRHRLFESNVLLFSPPRCSHKNKQIGFGKDDFVTVAGHGGNGSARLDNWQDAMGINWMNHYGLTQAIPPAYTKFIGKQILRVI